MAGGKFASIALFFASRYQQAMPRFAFKIEYNGAPFSGWQRQSNHSSVQGAIEDALSKLGAASPNIAAAGRTDAGVHALAQVAHCDLERDWDPFRLTGALNFHLKPLPIAVVDCSVVPDDWHARFSANGRKYLYRVISRRPPLVHDVGKAWQVMRTLDLDAMRAGAVHLIGYHDFTTFRSTMCQAKSPMKTLDSIEIEAVDYAGGQEIRVRLTARSFLHNQVRSIVGTLERVGTGAWTPDDVKKSLSVRDRAACGPVAPPDGLYLSGVLYDPDPF